MNTFGTITTQISNIPKIILLIGVYLFILTWIIYLINNIFLNYISDFSFIINIILFLLSFAIIGVGSYCRWNNKNENYNESIKQSKNNIKSALNDTYKNINNCDISDDMQGSFLSNGIKYNFYINEDKLYIIEENISDKNNSVKIIEGKNY